MLWWVKSNGSLNRAFVPTWVSHHGSPGGCGMARRGDETTESQIEKKDFKKCLLIRPPFICVYMFHLIPPFWDARLSSSFVKIEWINNSRFDDSTSIQTLRHRLYLRCAPFFSSAVLVSSFACFLLFFKNISLIKVIHFNWVNVIVVAGNWGCWYI